MGEDGANEGSLGHFPDDPLDNLVLLEEKGRGHCADTEKTGKLRVSVGIDPKHLEPVRILGREFGQGRCQGRGWTAPCRPEMNEYWDRALEHLFIKMIGVDEFANLTWRDRRLGKRGASSIPRGRL